MDLDGLGTYMDTSSKTFKNPVSNWTKNVDFYPLKAAFPTRSGTSHSGQVSGLASPENPWILGKMAIEIIGQCVRNVSEMSGKCSWKVLLVHPKSHRNFSWKVLLAHPKSEILMETGFHTMTAGPCLRALIGQRL